jgi:hypothetical protein
VGSRLAASILVLCVGCGGGAVISNSINGTVSGYSLTPLAAVSTVAQNGPSTSFAILMMTGRGKDECSLITAGHQLQSTQALQLRIATRTEDQDHNTTTQPPSLTGVYPVYPEPQTPVVGRFAILDFVVTDATCTAAQIFEAASGNLTLTRIDANGYSGTFDVTFSSGDHLSGSFDSATCAAIIGNVNTSCP